MLVSDTNKIEKRFEVLVKRGDLNFRFSNSFSKEARDFEESHIRLKPYGSSSFFDDSNIQRNVSWPNLSHWQSYRYLDNQKKPFYLLQMSNERRGAHYQVVICVEVSKIAFFKTGIIHKWIMDTDEDSLSDQVELIKELIKFCKLYSKLMSIRMQPYMAGTKKLEYVHKLLSPFGFVETAPYSNIKTRIIDLRPSIEEILSSFSTNGRARLKIKSKDEESAKVKEIDNVATIPFLQNALNASFKRSIKEERPYDFLPLFLRATQFANEVVILGFYLKEEAFEPKAFVAGIDHGGIVEYTVGGSLNDSRLRQFPFNHILMWQLVLRSKQNGSELLDMGGITRGGEDDVLTGITKFKRFFPGFELSTGREMELKLRPKIVNFYSILKNISVVFSKSRID